MATPLPSDEVLLEQALRGKIRDILMSVPIIADNIHVHTRERHFDNASTAKAESTIADFVSDPIRLISVIEIGEATVQEFERTNDLHTQLNFVYPMTFRFSVVDKWDNSDFALEFDNSTDFVTAVYMRARREFKKNRTFGYDNCEHDYLQRDTSGTVEPDDEDEDGVSEHIQDWSLEIKCSGILV